MSAMKRLFQLMADKKASDIFLSVSSPINIKINGVAVPVNQQVMDSETIIKLLYEVLTEKQIKEFEDTLELNTAFPMPGVGAFRISAMRQKSTPAVVVRYIPNEIPPIDSLALPEVLKEVIMEKRGLILMCGATGSGKSTSLASMLDYRNELKSGHILTLEDPVEFIFKNRKSIVNQREVGTDTLDFRIALKNALRQAPDCILIGEVRDKDTMGAAIAYAQSGHLCLATLHANNSYHALNRIISFYPLENRPALLQDLSAALKAIISQRLIRNKVGGRSAAVEVMLNTRHIAELIENRHQRDEGRDGQIHVARLADLRTGLFPHDPRRQDHPGRRHGQCRFADQPDLAAQQYRGRRNHAGRQRGGRRHAIRGRQARPGAKKRERHTRDRRRLIHRNHAYHRGHQVIGWRGHAVRNTELRSSSPGTCLA